MAETATFNREYAQWQSPKPTAISLSLDVSPFDKAKVLARDKRTVLSEVQERRIRERQTSIVSGPEGRFTDFQPSVRPLRLVTENTNATVSLPDSFSDKLIQARDIFSSNERQKNNNAEPVAYELEQDAMVYEVLANERGTAGYEDAKISLDAYIRMQMETHIGERLHVGISRFDYSIVDGELRTQDTNEPVLEMIKRGRDYRRRKGNSVDWGREDAEVLGMDRIQKTLLRKDVPIGTMMFFASPRGDVKNGSIYKQNFYEGQQKVSEDLVVVQRFTSGLTPEETQQRLAKLDPRYKRKTMPTDAESLANPIQINPGDFGFTSPDDVHEYMHKDHSYMKKEDFVIVRQACRPILEKYIQALTDNPNDTQMQNKLFRAYLNYADDVARQLLANPNHNFVAFRNPPEDAYVRPFLPQWIDVEALAKKQVRFVETGCGGSGDSSSASSVMEFGRNSEAGKNNCAECGKDSSNHHYHCPDCKKEYADETKLSSEERTKQCKCGFNFGC